jgi:N-methylhydantoinase B
LEMAMRLTAPAELTVRGDRLAIPPPGSDGGGAGGAGSFAIIRRDGSTEALAPRQQAIRVDAGDVVVLRTSGGGGLGSPSGRDRDAVLADVAEGRVSPEGAARDYGVDVA